MSKRIISLAVFSLIICMQSVFAESIRVAVSVLPLESIVREIGGDVVEVGSIQQEGDSCSVFEPRPSVVRWVADADLFLRVGAGFESVVLPRLANRLPGEALIDLREFVPVIAFSGHEHNHTHDEHCDHDTGLPGDPHVWLDPVRLQIIARVIQSNLSRLLPDHEQDFRESADRVITRLEKIDTTLGSMLTAYKGKRFYVYHPSLGYFADRYGLEQIPIAGDGHEPSARSLGRIISQARADNVKYIFVQPQESRRQAEIVADAIGAKLVEIDPMEADLFSNMLTVGEALVTAFEDE